MCRCASCGRECIKQQSTRDNPDYVTCEYCTPIDYKEDEEEYYIMGAGGAKRIDEKERDWREF